MKKNQKLYVILTYIGAVALAFVFGLLSGEYFFSKGDLLLGYLLFVVSLIAAIVIQTILHELGHLVFGLATGYGFLSFRIFSFLWSKEEGKIKFSTYSLAGTLGQCLLEPPVYSGKFPYVLYNFGGVIFNVGSSLLGLLLFLVIKAPVVKGFILIFIMYGIISAAINGIPLKFRMVNNDGMNALEASRDPSAKKAFYQQLQINLMMTKGRRLIDIPEDLFEYDDEKAKEYSLVGTIKVFCENRYMDMMDFDNTEILLNQLMNEDYEIPGVLRYMLLIDKEYIDCLKGRYVPSEDQAYLKALKSIRNNLSLIRTRIAISKVTGNLSMISPLMAEFDKVKAQYPYKGEVEREEELVQLILR